MNRIKVTNEKSVCNKDIFPFGAMYAPVARATEVPVSEWEKDVRQMKKLGFTIIRSWAAWDRIEQVEGQRDFSRLDYIFELAEKYDMKITLFIGGAFSSLMGCYPPAWLRNKCQAQTESSEGRDPSFDFCFDDPFYKRKAEEFLIELITRYTSRKALHSWIVWGEPSSKGCRCNYSLAKFHAWLENKYQKLDVLNEAWSFEMPVCYEEWEDIRPLSCSYVPTLDWQNFCEENLNDTLRWINDLVKKYARENQATITYPCPYGLDVRAVAGKNNFWKAGKTVDILGMSHYVFQYPHQGRRADVPACYLDRVRSAATGNNFWIVENQAGPILWNFKPPHYISPERNNLINAQMLAHGAKGILSWLYRTRIRDRQAGEFGLVGWDGSLTERALAMSELAGFVKKNADLLANSVYNADIAVLSANSTSQLSVIDGVEDENGGNYWQNSWLGAYKLIWDLKLQADFIDDVDIVDGKLKKYKVLLIPFRLNMEQDVADKITDFISNGGKAIADFSLGFKDNQGMLNMVSPGCGLDRLFGYSTVDASPVYDEDILFSGGKKIPTYVFQQQMTAKSSGEVIARFSSGQPAVISNCFGHGQTIMIASMFFALYEKKRTKVIKDLMAEWLNKVAVSPALKVVSKNSREELENIEVCKLDHADGRSGGIFFILNHNDERIELTCSLSGELSETRTLRELFRETDIDVYEGENGKQFDLALDGVGFSVIQLS